MDQGYQTAGAFVAARRAARGLPDYPGDQPTSLADAYAIQAHAIELTGEPVAGWKVGRINPPLDRRFGSNRLAGPIFAAQIMPGAGVPAMPVFADGFAAAEAEFLLRIGTTPDPERQSWSIEDTVVHIDAVHIGLEIASSPFPGINELGPLVTISDFGNNHGMVIGDPVAEWRDACFIDWPVRLTIDGVEAGAATAATMLDGPLGAARWLFGAMAARGMPLRAGQWISSGAVTGVHQVQPGARVTAHFADKSVSCSIEAARPADQSGERTNGRIAG